MERHRLLSSSCSSRSSRTSTNSTSLLSSSSFCSRVRSSSRNSSNSIHTSSCSSRSSSSSRYSSMSINSSSSSSSSSCNQASILLRSNTSPRQLTLCHAVPYPQTQPLRSTSSTNRTRSANCSSRSSSNRNPSLPMGMASPRKFVVRVRHVACCKARIVSMRRSRHSLEASLHYHPFRTISAHQMPKYNLHSSSNRAAMRLVLHSTSYHSKGRERMALLVAVIYKHVPMLVEILHTRERGQWI